LKTWPSILRRHIPAHLCSLRNLYLSRAFPLWMLPIREYAMSDLRGFTAPEPIETGNTGKIFGALAVALVVCAAGTYTYETGVWNSPTVRVADNDLPSVPVMARAPAVLAPIQPTIAPPVQNLQSPAPLQAAAPPRAEIARPRHALAQRSEHAVTIAPPEPAIEQTPTEIAPQAPVDAPASPQPESQSAAPQDTPAQTPQPDGTPQ
jgi:hypothetical protein